MVKFKITERFKTIPLRNDGLLQRWNVALQTKSSSTVLWCSHSLHWDYSGNRHLVIKRHDFLQGYFICLKEGADYDLPIYFLHSLYQHVLHMEVRRMKKSGCFLLPSHGIVIPAHYRVPTRPRTVLFLCPGSRGKTRGMSFSWWAKQFCVPLHWEICCILLFFCLLSKCSNWQVAR